MASRQKKPNKRKKPSRKQIVSKLDAVFSKYIRHKYAVGGVVECYTCGVKKPIKEMQNGHFISRRHYATRWSELNCKPQCYGCNVGAQGRQYEFGLHLDADYGPGTAEEILFESRKITKYTDNELLEKIEHYSKLLKKLE